jgi:hypothetical protein
MPKRISERRANRIEQLNDWLMRNGDWVLTTEGLKQTAINKHKLRIADYGVSYDFGETVFIGLLSECEDWAKKKGFVVQ